MDKLKILKIEVAGELPAGCPWCPFDDFADKGIALVKRTCPVRPDVIQSGYGYRPEGCPLTREGGAK